MDIKSTKTVYVQFSAEDWKLIDRLAREQVGDRTISSILDDFSYVFDCYVGLFNLIRKVSRMQPVILDSYEYNALAALLSKAYNDSNTTEAEKGHIKLINDAIDCQRNNVLRNE